MFLFTSFKGNVIRSEYAGLGASFGQFFRCRWFRSNDSIEFADDKPLLNERGPREVDDPLSQKEKLPNGHVSQFVGLLVVKGFGS